MYAQLRKSEERGKASLGWLESRHSFSFGHYHDPAHMGFGPLRVINEDVIAPGGGFPMHPHSDMEIVTYVLSGALEHKDSLGSGSVIGPGKVQRMSAGTGLRHSEFNPSGTEPVHLLQIWIEPEQRGLAPSYEEKSFAHETMNGRLALIGSRDGREGSITIHQDMSLFAAKLEAGQRVARTLEAGRAAWLQVVRGGVAVNGKTLAAGDALAVTDAESIAIVATGSAEILLFDLPRH